MGLSDVKLKKGNVNNKLKLITLKIKLKFPEI